MIGVWLGNSQQVKHGLEEEQVVVVFGGGIEIPKELTSGNVLPQNGVSQVGWKIDALTGLDNFVASIFVGIGAKFFRMIGNSAAMVREGGNFDRRDRCEQLRRQQVQLREQFLHDVTSKDQEHFVMPVGGVGGPQWARLDHGAMQNLDLRIVLQ